MQYPISRLFLMIVICSAIFSATCISLFWITGEWSRFQEDVMILKNEFIAVQKKQIISEVKRVEDFIAFKKSQNSARLEQTIQNRVMEAHAIALNLYEQHRAEQDPLHLKKMIKDALRPIRFNNGRGYYFITRLDGLEILFADRPELEGQNLMEMQDTQGKYVIRDMVDMIKTQGKGYYRYTWTKPGHRSMDFSKVSYIMHFTPFNWLIGTGEYVDDVADDLKQEALERIESIRFGDGDSIFAGQWDGLFLTGPEKGRRIMEINDQEYNEIVEKFILIARAGGAFLRYAVPGSGGKSSHKRIAYVTGIPEWEWYIGAGVDMDGIERVIADKKHELAFRIKKRIINILMILAMIIAIVVCVARVFYARIRTGLDRFIIFFENAAVDLKEIDASKLKFYEFKQLACSINRMITQRRRMEELIIQSEKMLSVGGLAAGMAHEINNPLAGILQNVQVIENRIRSDLPKNICTAEGIGISMTDINRYLVERDIFNMIEAISESGKRAARIVNNMLNFSRKTTSQFAPHDIHELLEQTLELAGNKYDLKKRFDFRGIEIIRDFDPNLPKISCEGTKIQQVLLNLFGNAAQALAGMQNNEPSRIILKTRQEAGMAAIEIADNGPGMNEDVRRRVFEPFFTTKSVGDGTGLGLSVSYFIITQNHQGTMTAASLPGKGAVFTIKLPI